MALSESQWLEKLRGFVPSWYFESEGMQLAHFTALAKLCAGLQLIVEEERNQTFIAQATQPYLSLHGSERSVTQIEDEPDDIYALRVRNLTGSAFKAGLKRIIDSLLLIGTCEIREGTSPDNVFLNRGSFLSRNEFLSEWKYNSFLIVIDRQVHAPYSFLSRDTFLNRGSYIGSIDSPDGLYRSIIAAVDAAKALGIMYRLVERRVL